jgi:hypothetical protein
VCSTITLVQVLLAAPQAVAQEGAGKSKKDVTVCIEAEQFQFPGDWNAVRDRDALGASYLGINGAKPPIAEALTAVELPRAGTYHLWTRAREFKDYQPGTRRFRLTVDGMPVENDSGGFRDADWLWQPVGTMELSAGEHMLGLRYTTSAYGRCDAILLTTGSLDPNKLTPRQVAQYRVAPKPVAVASQDDGTPKLKTDRPGRRVAQLDNGLLRISFLAQEDQSGAEQIVRRTELRAEDQWIVLEKEPQAERLFLLHAEQVNVRSVWCFPHWSGTTVPHKVIVAGKQYAVRDSANPFFAAPAERLVPRAAKQIDSATVEVQYVDKAGRASVGRWSLEPRSQDVRFSLTVTPARDGVYSVGFCAFDDRSRSETQFVQLPPLYQFQRLPNSAELVPSTMMPHPMALVQIAAPGAADRSACLAVVAEPARLPFRWAEAEQSPYGFSLLNAAGRVQPSIFSPVLGLDGSRWKAGSPQTVAWRLLAIPGDWRQSLAYLSDHVMGVKDYRRPLKASLTQAVLNMIDLMRDADASGWNSELKGFWNIEIESTVTHASPLAVVSAALLTRDEKLWAERALPTIEFTLTRPTAFSTRPKKRPAGPERLVVPTQFYGTSYWQGLDRLLGQLNPWIKDLALAGGKPRHSRGYNNSPEWSELLAAYRLQPDKQRLEEVCRQADEFIKHQIEGRSEKPISFEAFYNISFYPYWWDLLDLYELTGEHRYLDAAEQGAFHTLAGLWSHPVVPEGKVTVYPDGQFTGTKTLWWKDDYRYRLGEPRKPNDTPAHDVPAWEVAQVGLGLEQPSTYFTQKGGMRNIMMSVWSPHLMRMFQATGREIYRTYARNSIIGRFATYPGYYLTGYTDVQHDPKYPYRGPDVTSLYYHHIPPHLAFTVDFLVAQAGARSGGRIAFPWVKQQNYAWFVNRIYGPEPGTLYGQSGASLWLDGKAVSIDSIDVDWLAARSADRFWLVLMSQSPKPIVIAPKLDAQRIGLRPGATLLRYEGQNEQPIQLPAESLASVTIPPMGLVALTLPTDTRAPLPTLLPLTDGHAVRDLDSKWGQLHAFRIRSPLGHDSLYVAVTGGPAEGARVTLHLDGLDGGPRVCKEAPYEFSVYPWALDRPMQVTVDLESPLGGQKQNVTLTLPGTPPRK